MRQRVIKLLTLVVATFLAPQLNAQEADSLRSYLRIAAENNPAIKAEFSTYRAAVQQVSQAGAFDDPTLDMAFFFSPMDIVGGRQVADFSLMQMFPWFGTRKAARSEASHLAQAAYERFREQRDEVFYKVYSQWYSLQMLQEKIDYNSEHHKLLERLYELSKTKYTSSNSGSGGTTMSELFRIELEMNELESERESNLSALKAESAKLNALLNRPADSPLTVAGGLKQSQFLFNHNIMEQIVESNPTLEMLVEESKAYKAQEKYAHRASLPQFGIGVSYTLVNKAHGDMGKMWGTMNGGDMWMPMVSMTIPIFRKKYNSQKQQSQFSRIATEQQYANTLNQMEAEISGIRHQLSDAERKIALYQKQSELAESTYQLAIKEYMSNKLELNNLIDILRQLLDYQEKTAEAVADYNIKVAEIEKLVSFTDKIEREDETDNR